MLKIPSSTRATYTGSRAVLTVTEYGFTWEGDPAEVEEIRERRCIAGDIVKNTVLHAGNPAFKACNRGKRRRRVRRRLCRLCRARGPRFPVRRCNMYVGVLLVCNQAAGK
mgnify:CR=1 FL=1